MDLKAQGVIHMGVEGSEMRGVHDDDTQAVADVWMPRIHEPREDDATGGSCVDGRLEWGRNVNPGVEVRIVDAVISQWRLKRVGTGAEALRDDAGERPHEDAWRTADVGVLPGLLADDDGD